jgi:hypothetical protein
VLPTCVPLSLGSATCRHPPSWPAASIAQSPLLTTCRPISRASPRWSKRRIRRPPQCCRRGGLLERGDVCKPIVSIGVERRASISPLLFRNAMPHHLAGYRPLHPQDIARMWLRSLLVLNPDRLGSQKLCGWNVALIIAAMMVVPAGRKTRCASPSGKRRRSRMWIWPNDSTPRAPSMPQTMQWLVARTR